MYVTSVFPRQIALTPTSWSRRYMMSDSACVVLFSASTTRRTVTSAGCMKACSLEWRDTSSEVHDAVARPVFVARVSGSVLAVYRRRNGTHKENDMTIRIDNVTVLGTGVLGSQIAYQ